MCAAQRTDKRGYSSKKKNDDDDDERGVSLRNEPQPLDKREVTNVKRGSRKGGVGASDGNQDWDLARRDCDREIEYCIAHTRLTGCRGARIHHDRRIHDA
jgi:hypothetical protein